MNIPLHILSVPGRYIVIYPDGQISTNCFIGPDNNITLDIISGSFNPLHEGHKAIYSSISPNRYRYFEVSVNRIGKHFYNLSELEKVIEQFHWYAPVIITNAKRFVDKIKLFRNFNVNFYMGYDTFERMLQHHSIHEIGKMSALFYVVDRAGKSISHLLNINLVNNIIRQQIHEKLANISSSSLRNGTYSLSKCLS